MMQNDAEQFKECRNKFNSFSFRNCLLMGFLSATIVIGAVGCQKAIDEQSAKKKPLGELVTDVRFAMILDLMENEAAKAKDISVVRAIAADDKLAQDELPALAKAMGYPSSEEMIKSITSFQAMVVELKADYDFTNVSANQLKSFVAKAKEQPKSTLRNPKMQVGADPRKAAICERERTNCLVEVASEAFLLHVACGAADLSVIGGVLCHGAVVTWQAVKGDNCNIAAARCVQQ